MGQIYNGGTEIKYIFDYNPPTKTNYIKENIIKRIYKGTTLLWGGFPVPKQYNTGFPTKKYASGCSTKDYALFAGGEVVNTDVITSEVVSLNNSLVRNIIGNITSDGIEVMARANAGEYAVFAGGLSASNHYTLVAYAYNNSLVKSALSNLSTSLYNPKASLKFKNYALFAGGINSSSYVTSAVNAYSDSLVKSTPTSLSSARINSGAARTDDYALIAGGSDKNEETLYSTVDVYNSSLSRMTPVNLESPSMRLGGSMTKGYAVFLEGYNSNKKFQGICAFNNSLVRTRVRTSVLLSFGFTTEPLICAPHTYAVLLGETGLASDMHLVDENLVCHSISMAGVADRNGSAVLNNRVIMMSSYMDSDVEFHYLEVE